MKIEVGREYRCGSVRVICNRACSRPMREGQMDLESCAETYERVVTCKLVDDVDECHDFSGNFTDEGKPLFFNVPAMRHELREIEDKPEELVIKIGGVYKCGECFVKIVHFEACEYFGIQCDMSGNMRDDMCNSTCSFYATRTFDDGLAYSSLNPRWLLFKLEGNK